MIHGADCTCDTYGCQLRRKGVQVSPHATPNRRNQIPPRRTDPPSLNAVKIYQDRPGGTKMPILNGDGSPLRHKKWTEQKHKIKDQLAKVQAGRT